MVQEEIPNLEATYKFNVGHKTPGYLEYLFFVFYFGLICICESLLAGF